MLTVWAGLAGAAGVALAAVAAHRVEHPALVAASTMLILHAAAALALLNSSHEHARLAPAVTGLMLFAASLFGGDIALHALSGAHLFPMAAPTGGSLLILSWLLVAALGVIALRSK
jgi:uncharacterized membrane protein YgdD (TMEM256/DUF423 family)